MKQLEDDNRYSDLLQSCRGAGAGNFGILTRFTLRVYPVTKVLLFNIIYDIKDAAKVVDRIQSWAHSAPKNLGLVAATFACGVDIISISGQWIPSFDKKTNSFDKETNSFMDKTDKMDKNIALSVDKLIRNAERDLKKQLSLLDDIKPVIPATIVELTTHDSSNILSFLNPGLPFVKVRSSFFFDPISKKGLKKFFDFVAQPFPKLGEIIPTGQISILGGIIPSKLKDKNILIEENAIGWLQVDTFWQKQEDEPFALSFENHFFETIQPYLSKHAYYGYPDLELGPKYLDSYFGKYVPFLRQVKTKYDPKNIFKFKQSIPPLDDVISN